MCEAIGEYLASVRSTCSAAAATCTATASNSCFFENANICFVLTDDQGYGELGCHGNTIIQTPAIDALYADAVRVRSAAPQHPQP